MLAGLKSGYIQMFVVTAQVYGLEFPRKKGFEAGGIQFRPKWMPRSVRQRAEQEQFHLRTGEALVLVAAPHWTNALDHAHNGIFRLASFVLSFAEGRQVFFRNLSVEDEERVFRFEGWGRVGPPLKRPTRVLADKIPEFASKALTLVPSYSFQEQTHVTDAMAWVNETILASLANEELQFTMLWLALESLVLANASDGVLDGLLTQEQETKLRKIVLHWAKKERLDDIKRSQLGSRIGNLNRAPIADRILEFTKTQGIPLAREELGTIVDARNIIHHEPWTASYALSRVSENLERLVSRSICAVLGLDWKAYLNPSYHLKDSLLSRS